MLYRSDGRTATQRAVDNVYRNVILVDLTLEITRAKRLALAAADQSDPAAIQRAAGLLHAAGFAVSPLADTPGMLVTRTVAMLANEAAEAVHQGVCSVEDCDLAMCKGVNYPLGPLAWADALGPARVVSILDHLAHAYGEDRYRVSPLLRRKAITSRRFHHPADGTPFSTHRPEPA